MVHSFILWSVPHPTIPHQRILQQSHELTAYVSLTSKTYEEIAYTSQMLKMQQSTIMFENLRIK